MATPVPGPEPPVPGEQQQRGRRPAAVLLPWVTGYTGWHADAGPVGTHQGVASPHLTVLLCLTGAVEILVNSDPARPGGTFVAMVGGLQDGPALVATGPVQTGIQLRLTWRGARALFGMPAGELAGDTVDRAGLLGRRTDGLLDRLASAPDWPERFTLLDIELAALVCRGPGDRGVVPEVGYAWDRLENSGGTLRIGELAAEVGWSRRHLADRLRAETGLGPKTAARLIRFERACDRLRGPQRATLAEVAADAGYADQSHLSRDFRDLAGQTATCWLAERATS